MSVRLFCLFVQWGTLLYNTCLWETVSQILGADSCYLPKELVHLNCLDSLCASLWGSSWKRSAPRLAIDIAPGATRAVLICIYKLSCWMSLRTLVKNLGCVHLNQQLQAVLLLFSSWQKSFSARAVSRSHQRAEHILKNLQQEEEKKRLGREASLITAIPITQEACYEPTCTPSSEQEEEGVLQGQEKPSRNQGAPATNIQHCLGMWHPGKAIVNARKFLALVCSPPQSMSKYYHSLIPP